MLDERGVEHYDGTVTTLWLKDGVGYRSSADEGLNGYIHLHLWCTTPAQAIDATLGRGTCHIRPWRMEHDTGFFDCMECDCGYVADVSDWAKWHYCPNCGSKVVQS